MRNDLRVLSVLAVFAVAACHDSSPLEVVDGPPEVVDAKSRSFTIAAGQEIDFYFQNIGPGNYASPPTLSGSTITFLEETTPQVDPGGVVQLFHFKGVASGMTFITFQHSCYCTPPIAQLAYSVSDTVIVR